MFRTRAHQQRSYQDYAKTLNLIADLSSSVLQEDDSENSVAKARPKELIKSCYRCAKRVELAPSAHFLGHFLVATSGE